MTTTHAIDPFPSIREMLDALNGIARIHEDHDQLGIEISDEAGFRNGLIDRLIATAVFAEGPERDVARWVIRVAVPALGA